MKQIFSVVDARGNVQEPKGQWIIDQWGKPLDLCEPPDSIPTHYMLYVATLPPEGSRVVYGEPYLITLLARNTGYEDNNFVIVWATNENHAHKLAYEAAAEFLPESDGEADSDGVFSFDSGAVCVHVSKVHPITLDELKTLRKLSVV